MIIFYYNKIIYFLIKEFIYNLFVNIYYIKIYYILSIINKLKSHKKIRMKQLNIYKEIAFSFLSKEN